MKFKKLRKTILSTNRITLDVVGFGNVNCVHVDGVDCLLHGTEFYLDDTK